MKIKLFFKKNRRFISRGIFGALDMLPGITLITSQFEYGRKFLNLAGKLKGKALNFVDDTYKLGKTKIRATYNTVVSKTDDFGRAIRNQIDNIFTGKPQMEFAFTGGFSGYIDDIARSSDDLVEFASHAKNGTDDLARILSSQADEVSNAALKSTDEVINATIDKSDDLMDFSTLNKEEYLKTHTKEQYYEALRKKYGVNPETDSIIGTIDEIDLEDLDISYRRKYRVTEEELGADFPDHRSQQSFIDGKPTDKNGLKGSIRVDGYNKDIADVLEYKNYNVQNAQGRSNLVNNIKKQYQTRIDGLPPNTSQNYILDIRGQNVNWDDMKKLSERIFNKTDGKIELRYKIR